MKVSTRADVRKKRVVLKFSGEMLGAPAINLDLKKPAIELPRRGLILDPKSLIYIVEELYSCSGECELFCVVGGGNWGRGSDFRKVGLDDEDHCPDFMGMVVTILNVMAVSNSLNQIMGKGASVCLSSIETLALMELYQPRRAVQYLETGKVVLLGGGRGDPGVSTDSAAAAVAQHIKADVILKATKVDGVFDKDPMKHPDAKLYEHLTYKEFLQGDFSQILDTGAVAHAKTHRIPIRVIDGFKPGNIRNAILGKSIGTLICDSNYC